MLHKPIENSPANYPFLFSVCTIVSNMAEYEQAKQSFISCGFTDECEYLISDNSSGNQFSAYEAIAGFLKGSSAQYVIIVHQDVRCIDNKETLIECLNKLTQVDTKWAVCGNAGSSGYHQQKFYLQNVGKEKITEGLPAKVASLDENLLIINRNTNLTLSADLAGFHLYGTDLCLVADFLGYNSYVIPFMVNHLSIGNIENLKIYQEEFIRQYGKKFRSRFIETTCSKFYLSNSPFKNRLFNHPLIFPFLKMLQRIRFTFHRLSFQKQTFKTVKKDLVPFKNSLDQSRQKTF